MNKLAALSMFSGGGIAETYFSDIGVNVVVANELLPERANFYKSNHPSTNMICGSICDEKIFNAVINEAKKQAIQFLLATPPCQGMSTLGLKQYSTDTRNTLFYYILDAIDILSPAYILIENVPKFLKLKFLYNDQMLCIVDILQERYGEKYVVEARILNAMHYGVPQSRPRIIIKMYKKDKKWPWPQEECIITLKDAIGDLPSLEPGEDSCIKWHSAKFQKNTQLEALRHTPEGCSAMKNLVFFPKKKDGTPVKGFHNTYKRMKWDEPAPARTTNSALVSGHNNVHPGRYLGEGLWSDARALTLRELIIVSSLPLSWYIPPEVSEMFVREIIGEAIPPMMCKKIVQQISELN